MTFSFLLSWLRDSDQHVEEEVVIVFLIHHDLGVQNLELAALCVFEDIQVGLL